MLARRLVSAWYHLVVLERLARGGGTIRWYFPRSQGELERVFEELRGGSCVSFYFDEQLHVERDDEEARQRMFDEVSPAREIVVGYPLEDEIDLEVELPTGPSELGEILMHHSEGDLVVWGPWPSREGSSGGTITIDLVDADGVLRAHPH
jgi:hypothetical protein